MERMKAKAAAAGKDKVKPGVIAKSLIIWEVKPWEAETDLDELAKKLDNERKGWRSSVMVLIEDLAYFTTCSIRKKLKQL